MLDVVDGLESRWICVLNCVNFGQGILDVFGPEYAPKISYMLVSTTKERWQYYMWSF